ncbi:MAG: hypothetical protein ACM3Q0_04360 [Bacteroidota bacterium]
MYSLKQAADAVGRGKPAVLKAIKAGRISAHKNENGEWQIDPAELHRVYPIHPGTGSGTTTGERQETPNETSGVAREIEMLRERLAEKDELIGDLREDRNRWRAQAEQATRLLTDQRPAPQPGARRGWWWRLVDK